MSRDLKQAVVTNIQASPLSTSTPDFLSVSLINLAQSYLQTRNVAHLGHAIRMMRPFAGSLCRANGLETFNEMIRTDPEIKKNIHLLYLASTSNTTSFVPPETFATTREQAYADNAASFMKEVKEQMEYGLDAERQKMVYDMLRYGNGIGEITYQTGYGRLKDRLTIEGVRSVDLRTCVFITDAFNRIIGYAPYGFPGVIAPLDTWLMADGFITLLFDHFENQRDRVNATLETQMLPRHKVVHLQWLPCSDEPRGEALLDAAFQPWWAKQQIIPILLFLIEQWGVPRKKGELSERPDEQAVYDDAGDAVMENGVPKIEPPLVALQKWLSNWGAGGAMSVPKGYGLDIMQANPGMGELMLKAIDFFNREIDSAITNQFLTAGQGGKSGGEKGVQSHRDVLSLMIMYLKNIQSRGFREQMSKVLIGSNFGKASKRFAPSIDLGDSDGFPVSLDEIGFLAQSMPNFFTDSMMPEVGRKVGMPFIPGQNKVKLPKSAAKDVVTLQNIINSQLACAGNGNFTIEFEG